MPRRQAFSSEQRRLLAEMIGVLCDRCQDLADRLRAAEVALEAAGLFPPDLQADLIERIIDRRELAALVSPLPTVRKECAAILAGEADETP
jgi:hypothetical protein